MKVDERPVAELARTTPRKRRLKLFLIAFAIVLIAWIAVASIDAYRVARAVRAGRAEFKKIAALDSSGGMQADALAGARDFEDARRIANNSIALGMWARVPLLGRPAAWLRKAAGATATLSHDASDAIGRIEPALHTTDRMALLRLLDTEFTNLAADVARVHLPSTGGFFPPVNAASDQLTHDLARLRTALTDGIAGVRGLDSMLEGSRYLVLAANNAEMRAGGMVLQAGLLTSARGHMSAGYFTSTADLKLAKPVALPAQIQTLYGWLSPGTEWRNVGSSPNFPVTAPIYAAMAQARGKHNVDGLLQIDVIGMRALLQVVGPVGRYNAGNVEQLLLHDQYARFGAQQVERRQEFSHLAEATFKALNDRPWDFVKLARALREAAAGRHLMAWSRRPVEEAAWQRLQMDGALDPDGLMLTVQNQTGNKLDWFVQPQMALSVEQLAGGWRRMHLRISIANPTPLGQPSYIAGDGKLVPPGTDRALVAV
ncbi:MAG TPA: DUF4012 domain-containing protein, partial [Actinomycetota bacterium]|nr:DUF4012 domain-containing protein [Actinomycetota bacterium]